MKGVIPEFLATYLLVFLGTGAVIWNDQTDGSIGQLGIAVAFGGAVALGILLFGRFSGAHMNPAVTIALALGSKFSRKDVPAYLVSQCLGAIAASFTLHRLFPQNEFLGTTLPSGTVAESFWLEFGLTFLLMAGVFFVSRGKSSERWLAPLLLGTIVGLEAYFAGPICGASMNPARSLGPALVSGHLQYLWLYLVATTLGALMVTLFMMLGRKKSTA